MIRGQGERQREGQVTLYPCAPAPELWGHLAARMHACSLALLQPAESPLTPPPETLTVTAPLHLPDAVQGVSDEVWEASIEVH